MRQFLNEQLLRALLNENLYYAMVNEENHKIEQFRDVILYITEYTLNYLSRSREETEPIYTGYAFFPEDGHDAYCDRVVDPLSDVDAIDKGFFPIYLSFVHIGEPNLPLVVDNRSYEPLRIVVIINLTYVVTFGVLREDKLKQKIRHELAHARGLYAKFGIPLHGAKKYQTMDIEQQFLTDNDFLNTRIYETVTNVLYMFSPTEMDARLNETVEAINLKSDEDFDKYRTSGLMPNLFIIKVVADFDDAHGISYMLKLINYVRDAYSLSQYFANLIIAWHFKKTRRHKDPLVTKPYIENHFLTKRIDDNDLTDISYNLANTLENILYNFEKRLYDAVYNDLRKRNLI